MPDTRAEAESALNAHARSIDALHQRLAAMPGCNNERLTDAVDRYKAAHQAFHDDALGCVGQ